MRYVALASIALLVATGHPTVSPQASPSLALRATARQAASVRYEKVYPLQSGEGVFAYARISPDGRTLAYASMTSNRMIQTVVDLPASKVLFTDPGIDAYWSLDGRRMIYLAQSGAGGGVTIRHHASGELVRNVAPSGLGDYFSWAVRDGRNLILTIASNYYYLDGDKAVLPAGRVPPCPDIGVGERPLISKDGRRITTFVRGAVVVRGLTDCDNIIDTGLQGAKADFSFDGRYVAFHVARQGTKIYDIVVVDLERRTMRTLGDLPGSSLFPSWTEDGRLCFRYDGDDYRGFMIASNVLSLPERPLPSGGARVPATLKWNELFPETPLPAAETTVVMIWAAWSAHSSYALEHLQQASRTLAAASANVRVLTAIELSSRRADVDRLRQAGGITLPEIPVRPDRLGLTEALNQIPTTLRFRRGVLVDRRLGAQSADELIAWVAQPASARVAGYGEAGSASARIPGYGEAGSAGR